MRVELPARAFFSFRVPVAPKPQGLRVDGSLGEWGDATLLPDLRAMDGERSFAQVRLAWSAEGLYVGVHVEGKTQVVAHRQHPRSADALFVWIDTRDVRDVHRASRFCHQFVALPRGGGSDRRKATAWQLPIRRSRESAPLCSTTRLKVASKVREDGYSMELALPADVLNGYDPEESARLGFNYLVCDHELGGQTWSVPGGLPFDHDPSTWASVELTRGPAGSTEA
jgi:hypothetical protein